MLTYVIDYIGNTLLFQWDYSNCQNINGFRFLWECSSKFWHIFYLRQNYDDRQGA